jgi:sugar phosphate isomerase/epimerase
MPNLLTRRSFLGSVAAVPLTASGLAADAPARIVRPGPQEPRIKLSCNIFSFNEPLTAHTLKLEEALDFCAELGFEAVDVTGYYFPGYPEAPPDSFVYAIKRRALRLGLEISGTGVRNDFTVADLAQREAHVALVKRWVDVAVKLGAPMVRVFSGAGVPAGATAADASGWVLAHLKACVAYAAERGIVIVLQPHNDFIKTAQQTLDLVERVDSDWFGLNVDVGSLRATNDPYAEIARLAPHAYTWQIKEQVYRENVAEDIDLARVVRILRETHYRGYVPLEALGSGDLRPRLRAFTGRMRQALG